MQEMLGGRLSRRSLLRTGSVGITGSLAGCVNIDFTASSSEPPPFGPPDTDWPMPGYDAANTGFSPDATGPTTEPEIEWEVGFDRDESPEFALAENWLVVAGDDELHCFDLESGEQSWSLEGDETAPVAVDADERLVYGNLESGTLAAYALEDGTEQWNVAIDETLQSVVVCEGTVYAVDEAGTILGVSTDGIERWRASISNQLYTAITTDGDRVSVNAREDIVTLDAADGERLWDADLTMYRSPILVDGTVHTGRRSVRTFDAVTGEQEWEHPLELTGSTAPPGFANGTMYFGDSVGIIQAVDVANETSVWATDAAEVTYGNVIPKIVRGGETVFIGTHGRGIGIGALAATDGTRRWGLGVSGDENVHRIAVVGDRLLVGTSQGRLLSLVEP